MEKIIENLCAEFLPKGRDLSTFKPKEILHLQMAFEQGAMVMMNYLKNTKEDKTNEKLINDIRERRKSHMIALRNCKYGSEDSINLKARISECQQIISIINDR